MSNTADNRPLPAGGENRPDETATEVSKTQTLLQHLLALRKVLIISAAAIAVAFFVVFYFFIDSLMAFITEPIVARNIEIIYTAMSEALVTKFKVALIAAVVCASPVVFWQLWSFIRPALYQHERKAFRLVFFIALFLFLAGVFFCYNAIYMLAVDFFLVAGDNLAKPMLSIDKYVGFLFGFLIPFGVAFELPVAVWFTTKMGWTNARMLASKRKYILLAIFVFAAVLTPPDVVSQVALGIPMYLLYEVGIQVSRLTKPRVPPEEE